MSTTVSATEASSREMYALLGFLLTSARGLIEEPVEYGPMRLMEAASRLCTLIATNESYSNETVSHLKSAIDSCKAEVSTETLTRTLDEIILIYTRRLKQK